MLHEGRERIVVNSAGFFIRETRMERFFCDITNNQSPSSELRVETFGASSEHVSAEELESQCPVRRLSSSARKTLLNSVVGETSEDLYEFLHYLRKTRCQRPGRESAAGFCLDALSSALLPTVLRTWWREQREIYCTVRCRIRGVIFTTPKICSRI